MQKQKIKQIHYITVIVLLEHDSVIRRENALGNALLDDLRTLAPVRSPSSSLCRNPADLHVLNGFVTRPSFEFDG